MNKYRYNTPRTHPFASAACGWRRPSRSMSTIRTSSHTCSSRRSPRRYFRCSGSSARCRRDFRHSMQSHRCTSRPPVRQGSSCRRYPLQSGCSAHHGTTNSTPFSRTRTRPLCPQNSRIRIPCQRFVRSASSQGCTCRSKGYRRRKGRIRAENCSSLSYRSMSTSAQDR